ncbi:zinc finger protein 664-like [Sardina pilchardus]|uniref:zinc finger protein 664-like n=1 Tax=Sardina pilchardus TaxID=27697 RepID=UPI002E13E8AC
MTTAFSRPVGADFIGQGRRSEAQKKRWQKFRLRTGPTQGQPSFAQDEWSETQMQMDLGRPFAEPHLMDLSMVETKDIKEEDYGHMIPCVDEDEQDEEEKPFAELNCKTEMDVAEYNITYSEPLQTTAEIEVKIEDEDEHLQESNFLQERVSEHLDCIQQKIYEQNYELNLQLKGSLYHCAVCRKSFTALKVLKKHQKMHSVKVNEKKNSGKKQHKCPHCEEILRTARNLKSHMLKHAYSKNYKCPQCGKDFARSNDLKRHMLSHAGEMKCAQCGKTFLHPSKLKNHMLTHTGERPHECAQCGGGFIQMSNLKTHMLIHTGEKPHTCVQCGRGFIQNSNLKTHMLTHTGEKPHKCVQCGRGFIQITNLKRHMLIHTGEKPHKCVHCGKAFAQSSNLSSHVLMIHTGNKPQLESSQCQTPNLPLGGATT